MAIIYRFEFAEGIQRYRIDVYKGDPGAVGAQQIVYCPASALVINDWKRGFDEYPLGLRKTEVVSLSIDLSELPEELVALVLDPVDTDTTITRSAIGINDPFEPEFQSGVIWVVMSTLGGDNFKPRNVFIQKQGVPDEFDPEAGIVDLEIMDIRRDVLEQIQFEDVADWLAHEYEASRTARRVCFDFYYYEGYRNVSGSMYYTRDHYMNFYKLREIYDVIALLYKKGIHAHFVHRYFGVTNYEVIVRAPQSLWLWRKQHFDGSGGSLSGVAFDEIYVNAITTTSNAQPIRPGWDGGGVGGLLLGKGSLADRYKNVYDFLETEFKGCCAKDSQAVGDALHVKPIAAFESASVYDELPRSSMMEVLFSRQAAGVSKVVIAPGDTQDGAFDEEFSESFARSIFDKGDDAVINVHNMPCARKGVNNISEAIAAAGIRDWVGVSIANSGSLMVVESEARYTMYYKAVLPDTNTYGLADRVNFVRVHEFSELKLAGGAVSYSPPNTSYAHVPYTMQSQIPARLYGLWAELALEIQRTLCMPRVAARIRLLMFGTANKVTLSFSLPTSAALAVIADTGGVRHGFLWVDVGATFAIDVQNLAGRYSSAYGRLSQDCTVFEVSEKPHEKRVDVKVMTKGW